MHDALLTKTVNRISKLNSRKTNTHKAYLYWCLETSGHVNYSQRSISETEFPELIIYSLEMA